MKRRGAAIERRRIIYTIIFDKFAKLQPKYLVCKQCSYILFGIFAAFHVQADLSLILGVDEDDFKGRVPSCALEGCPFPFDAGMSVVFRVSEKIIQLSTFVRLNGTILAASFLIVEIVAQCPLKVSNACVIDPRRRMVDGSAFIPLATAYPIRTAESAGCGPISRAFEKHPECLFVKPIMCTQCVCQVFAMPIGLI